MIFSPLGVNQAGVGPEHSEQKKKPTRPNTLRYLSTSVYSLTNPSARPSCPLSSHPKSFKSTIPVELFFSSYRSTNNLIVSRWTSQHNEFLSLFFARR
jgi:hypothetical protein